LLSRDVYQAPRELLRAIPGARLFELERIKEKSFCCGAGGGRMWMEENLGTRINENRTKEILKTGANHVCTACPFCLTMLDDAIKAKAENVQVLDISEILLKVLNQNKDN